MNTLRNSGYKLVRVKENKGSTTTLQFMIEHNNFKTVAISDCVKVSKILSTLLENSYIINSYNIEVSSTGIERPLIEYSDFIRYIGSKISLEVEENICNKIKFIGKLIKCEDEKIEITQHKSNAGIIFDFKNIKNANLVYEF